MNRLGSLVADLPEDINRLIVFGDFTKALELIDLYMTRNIPKILKDRLIFEKIELEDLSKIIYIPSMKPCLLLKKKLKIFQK